jgi:hypothetical protein
MPKFFENLDENKISKFSGILVVGDVHGNIEAFTNAVNHATKQNLYIVSLGDLVDYGSNSKEVVDLAKSLYDQKRISIVLGNHERKFQKWVIQNSEGHVRITIKEPIQASIDSFNHDKVSLNSFLTLYSDMTNVMKYKNVYFTHGALHKALLTNTEFNPIAYQYALFGEVDPDAPKRDSGYPNRIYAWVKNIPDDIKVYVGHDIRDFETPFVEDSVCFLDTGSSKEGVLSGAVLNVDGTLKEYRRF